MQKAALKTETSDYLSGLITKWVGATVFYALVALVALAAIPYGTVDPLWIAVFECAVFGLAILFIIEVAINLRPGLSSFRLALPLLALVAYAFIQTLSFGASRSPLGQVWQAFSADPFETRRWAIKMLATILLGAMLLRYTNSLRRLRLLVGLILIMGAASALFGLFRQTTQRGKGFLFLSRLQPEMGYAQFINKNHFAFLAEMVLGLTLGLLISRSVKKESKLIYLSVSLPLWTALVLSNSRGGIFSMLCQLLFLAMLWSMTGSEPQRRAFRLERLKSSWPIRILLLCSLLAFSLVGTIWMGGDPLVSRLEAVSGEISSAEGSHVGTSRLEIWRSTWSLIKEHPVTGVGFGGYWATIPQYHQASGEATPQEAHNDYLELMASGGIIGLLLVIWFLLALIFRVRKVWATATGYRRAALMGALTGIFGVALHSLFDYGLHIAVNALLLTALVVIATVEVKAAETASETSRL